MKTRKLAAIQGLCLLVLLLAFIILIPSCATYQTKREGYRVYNKYGFSFEYPQYFVVGELGMFEGPASYYSGAVIASNPLYEELSECIIVVWLKITKSIVKSYEKSFLEEGLNSAFDESFKEFFKESTGRDESIIEHGELVESKKAGHLMLCQYYVETDPEDEDFKALMRLGIWYCAMDQKVYMVFYFNSNISKIEDVIKEYQNYIDRFTCH
ncbi:MAG: hypothetical protein JSV25_04945 [Spirochaetota bacterium]|nr:MAG: hypothetical protein JSV25_04945 [Spirochaetota bacterium]